MILHRILLIHLLYSYLQNIDLGQLNPILVFQTYMVHHYFLRCLHVRYLDRFAEALLPADLSFYPTRKYDFWKYETKISFLIISILTGLFEVVFKICNSLIRTSNLDMHQLDKVKICIWECKVNECQSQANVIQK